MDLSLRFHGSPLPNKDDSIKYRKLDQEDDRYDTGSGSSGQEHHGETLLSRGEGVYRVTPDYTGECSSHAVVNATKDTLGSISTALGCNVIGDADGSGEEETGVEAF